MVHGKCLSEVRPRGEAAAVERPNARQDAPEVDSRALFGEARTIAIRHGAEVYTLRITRADKLILTK